MKPEEAVRRAKWQLNHYRGDGIVPIDCETLSALLEGYNAAVKQGVWRPVGFDKRGRGGVWVCSSCKRCQPYKSDFCPMCGADLRGPEPGGSTSPPDNYIGEQPVAYGAPFDEPGGESKQ